MKKNLFLTIVSLVFLFLLAINYFFEFLDTNFFVGIVTFLVGTFAIFLYIQQSDDGRRDAASIILMEIRHAEKTVDRMKADLPNLDPSHILLNTNNWSDYNHLFIKDLDSDELDLINTFYINCRLIDRSIAQLDIENQLFDKANHIQGRLAQIALDANGNSEEYDKYKKNFLDLFTPEKYVFIPEVSQKRLINTINAVRYVTTSTAGQKLKKIARLTK